MPRRSHKATVSSASGGQVRNASEMSSSSVERLVSQGNRQPSPRINRTPLEASSVTFQGLGLDPALFAIAVPRPHMNSGDSGSGGSNAGDFNSLQLDPAAFVIAGLQTARPRDVQQAGPVPRVDAMDIDQSSIRDGSVSRAPRIPRTSTVSASASAPKDNAEAEPSPEEMIISNARHINNTVPKGRLRQLSHCVLEESEGIINLINGLIAIRRVQRDAISELDDVIARLRDRIEEHREGESNYTQSE